VTILSARLIESLMPEFPALPEAEATLVRGDVMQFVELELRIAPAYLRAVTAVLGLVFSVFAALPGTSGGGRTTRAVTLCQWLMGPPGRTYLRLIRSLAVLAFLEHPVVQETIGAPSTADRHDRYRAKRDEVLRSTTE
jgi:hypothetical protein